MTSGPSYLHQVPNTVVSGQREPERLGQPRAEFRTRFPR